MELQFFTLIVLLLVFRVALQFGEILCIRNGEEPSSRSEGISATFEFFSDTLNPRPKDAVIA